MKIKIPKRVRTGFSFGERSATATYKTIERVLTSSTPQGGWRSFILENLFIPVSFTSGLLLCLSAVAYTRNLSTHLLVCPDWAYDCEIRPYITWNANNPALVQGLVTVTYSIGLTLMICSVRSTTESAIWPLLTRNPLSFDQIETYLDLARGQLFSASSALHLMRKNYSATFSILTLSITVMSLVVAPLIGFVFAISDLPRQFLSMYQVGSGTEQIFVQTNPPTSMDIDALVEYQSWAKKFTEEPMPGYRDWIVDRNVLKNFNSIKASAIHTLVDIECHGYDVTDYEITRPDMATFATKMGRHDSTERQFNSSKSVEVPIPHSCSALVIWVDDFEFLTPVKSSATLIFAEFNGTIENGFQSNISGKPLAKPMPFSTIACNVEVELRDDILRVGNGTYQQESILELSSKKYLTASYQNGTNSSRPESLNEFALWLAVAPVLVGPSVGGLQPSYSKSDDGLAVTLSNTDFPSTPENWTIVEIENFIRIAIGAVALSSSRKSTGDPEVPIRLPVRALTRKMIPERVVFLLIPVGFVLACGFILLCLSIHLHRQHNIPIMRLAPISEVLKSSQSKLLATELAEDAREPGEVSGIGGLYVIYGLTRGMQCHDDELVAGLSSEVESFEGMSGTMMRRLV